jgi:hypothetical protein
LGQPTLQRLAPILAQVAVVVVRLYESILAPAIRRDLRELGILPAEQGPHALSLLGLPAGGHVHLSVGINSENPYRY